MKTCRLKQGQTYNFHIHNYETKKGVGAYSKYAKATKKHLIKIIIGYQFSIINRLEQGNRAI